MKTPTKKHQCAGRVWRTGAWKSSECAHAGVIEHEGYWWCKRHHPPAVKEKEDARRAKQEARWDATREAWDRNEKRAALLAELESLAIAEHEYHETNPNVGDPRLYDIGAKLAALKEAKP